MPISSPGKSDKVISIAVFALLSAVIAVIYSNAFQSPFIFDDSMYITKNTALADLSNFKQLFPRYLGLLSFAVDYRIAGLDPRWYHGVNILIHAVNSYLVFRLVTLLFRTGWFRSASGEGIRFPAALLAALLFASHPVQTQAVTYITQRFASLAALFYLLSITAFLKWRTSERLPIDRVYYVLALASAALAQFTKEISATLPFVILAIELCFGKSREGRFKALAPFFLVLSIIPFLLFWPGLGSGSALGGLIRPEQVKDLSISKSDYLITQFRVIATYLRLLVLPVGQRFYYDFELYHTFFKPGIILSALLLLAVFAAAVFSFIKARKERACVPMLFAFGVMFFFTALSVESSIIPIRDVCFEHRLYLPNAGSSIAFASIFVYAAGFINKRLGKRGHSPAPYIAIALFLIPLLGTATYLRNGVWKDEIAFWEDSAQKSPSKFRVRYNLGMAYKDRGMIDKAAAEFEKAVRIYPFKINARNNLGLAYCYLGRYNDAIEQFKTAISFAPGNYRAHMNLEKAYELAGDRENAAKEHLITTELRVEAGQMYED